MKSKILSVFFALVLALSLSLVTAVPVGAQLPSEVWVDDGFIQGDCGGHVWGVDAFATIQEGIVAVDPTGIVNVADGDYNADTTNSLELVGGAEYCFVHIDKPITLLGQSRDGVILDGTGLYTANRSTGIWVSVSNVTVKNLTLQNFKIPSLPDNTCYGLYVIEKYRGPYDDGVATLDKVTAENLKATGNMMGLYFMKTEHVIVKDCLVENSGEDGIWVAWGSDYATVQGNTVTNSDDHGIWVGTPWFAGLSSNNAVITGNTIDGAREGGISFINSTGASISGNSITNVAGGAWNIGQDVGYAIGALNLMGGPSNVEAFNNTIYSNIGSWHSYDNPGTGHGVGIDGTPSNINLYLNNIYDNTGYGVYNYSTVDATATNNWWGDPSGPGDVGPGTGDEISTYVVDYTPWLGDLGAYAWIDTNLNSEFDLGECHFATIQDAIDSATEGNTISVAAGEYNETVVLKDTTATGISIIGQDKTTTFITGGIGFAANYSGLKVQHFTISGNGFLGTETYQATVSNVWPGHRIITDLEFSDCIFDGEGYDDGKGGRTGIVIKRLGGVVKFVNNDFKNYPGWATLDVNDGSGGGALTVTSYTLVGNDFLDNGGAVALRGNPEDYTDTVIATGNTFDGPAGWAALEINQADNVEIHDNVIRNVEEFRDWEEGQAMQLWQVGTVEIYENTIEDNYQGIAILNYPEPYDISNISVHHNSFSGNAEYALSVDDGLIGGPLNAKNNWWEHASGPEHATLNTGGQGNAVSDNVNFSPWLYHAHPAPSIATSAASSVTMTSAILRGNLNSLGSALQVDVSFEWGLTTAYGNTVAVTSLSEAGIFSATISGLSAGTTYHFMASAEGKGTSHGIDRAFTTRPAAGGGGFAPPAPPAGTTNVRGMITTAGEFRDDTTAISDDELCTLSIPAGTVGLTGELEAISEITMTTMTAEEQARLPTPTPDNIIVPEGVAIPADAYIVSLVYDFGPPGATFEAPIIDDQAVMLTLSYDETLIPAGVTEENLIIVYWNEMAGKWEALQNIVIDSDNNTVSGELTHFTAFAILGLVEAPPPAPAAFSVSNLAIEPAEVQLGEEVTVTVSVANTGGSEGSYSVVLNINGVKEAEKSISIRAGGSVNVTFSVTREDVRSYDVVVDGMSGSFTVLAPAPPAPPKPAPPTPVVPPAEPINWPLIGGIIAAGVLIVALSFFFLIRRRAH